MKAKTWASDDLKAHPIDIVDHVIYLILLTKAETKKVKRLLHPRITVIPLCYKRVLSWSSCLLFPSHTHRYLPIPSPPFAAQLTITDILAMDYSLQGSMKSFVFYNRKGNSHAGQVILIVFLVLLLMFTAVIIWAQNKPPVQLPSYYLSKKQYYDLMMDPTATKSILPTHVNFTQLERSYPTYFHLVDLLSKWPANDVSSSQWIESPAYPAGGNGLFRLNYMNPSERALAQSLRDRELPFVLFNIPELDNAADTDFAAKTLLRHLESERLIVERSLSNEFMYFLVKNKDATKRKWPEWSPPQERYLMSFRDFVAAAERAETVDLLQPHKDSEYFYLTVSGEESGEMSWILKALPIFEPKDSLFMYQNEEFRGVKCRFGMKGIIAAPHFDSRRNFVAMVRGRKRYILLPPNECKNLKLYPRGHPSARHSSISWADAGQLKQHPELASARATEVVLRPGEVLYIPSFWFHYIISQDASIQCNCRSGEAEDKRNAIDDCGFEH